MDNDQHTTTFPHADTFTRMWLDFATKVMGAGMAFSPEAMPPEAARQTRSAMLNAWAEYCDEFMRSPEFLDMLRQSLSTAMQARKQFNDFLGQVQHEFQGTSRQDVDQLMLSIRHLEHRLVDAVERISGQMEEIRHRLEQLEQTPAGKQDAGQEGDNTNEG